MERIIIQPDWDEILKEKSPESFWIQYKFSTAPAINGKLCFGGSDERLDAQKQDNLFKIVNISNENKSIIVSYSSPNGVSLKRKFVAPVQKFTPHIDSKNGKIKPVTYVDVTDGGLGVSCSLDGSLLLWLAENGQIRRNFDGHLGDVNFCKFFPSGMVVISGAADLRMKIWSVENGSSPVTLTGHHYGPSDVCIVDRGRNVVSVARDGQCKLFDVGESNCLSTIAKVDSIINSCSIVSLSHQNMVKLNIPPREEPLNEREIATEDKLVALACESGHLKIYSLRARKQIFEFNCESAVNCCCFLNETTVACGTHSGFIFIFDMIEKNVNSWKEFRSSILSISPINNIGFMATTGDGSCFACSLESTAEMVVDLTGPNCDPVYKSAFNDSHVFTCCRDGFIRKYKLTHLLND